jgi:hypothetical protein
MIDLAKIDTTIHLGDIVLHQPVTAITDFIVTALCFYFYNLLKLDDKSEKSVYYWRWFYLTLGISTFFGGCSHGFFTNHTDSGYQFFWLTMQLFNGFAVYAAQHATLTSALQHSKNKNLWNYISVIQLILFVSSVFIFRNFIVVTIDIALGLIPVMVIHFKDEQLNASSKWIAYGILVSFLTAVVHLSKFSLDVYFNYLDIAHVLIMINLSIMFVGIKQKTISVTSL